MGLGEGLLSPAVIPGVMRPVPKSTAWATHPSNWAVTQGHMLGTEPRSFRSLPTDRNFSLVSLEETSPQHVNVVAWCPLQLRAAG